MTITINLFLCANPDPLLLAVCLSFYDTSSLRYLPFYNFLSSNHIHHNSRVVSSVDDDARQRCLLGVRFKLFLDFPCAGPVFDGASEAGSRSFGAFVCDFTFEAAEATTEDDVLAGGGG